MADIHTYDTRQEHHLTLPITSLKRTENIDAKLYNSLPLKIRSNSFHKFKQIVKVTLIKTLSIALMGMQ